MRRLSTNSINSSQQANRRNSNVQAPQPLLRSGSSVRRVTRPSNDNISGSVGFSQVALSNVSNEPRRSIDAAYESVSLLNCNDFEISSSLNCISQEFVEKQPGFERLAANIKTLRQDHERHIILLNNMEENIAHEEKNTEKLKGENNQLKGKVARLKTVLNKTFLGKWFDKHSKSGTFLATVGGLFSVITGSMAVTVAVEVIGGLVAGGVAVAAWPVLVAALAVGATVLAVGFSVFCALKIRDYYKMAQAENNPSSNNIERQESSSVA